jgi:hypothetical protein
MVKEKVQPTPECQKRWVEYKKKKLKKKILLNPKLKKKKKNFFFRFCGFVV